MSHMVTSILLAHRAKAGDMAAMVEIVDACWKAHPELTAKQIHAEIRNSTDGKLTHDFVRDGILKYLGLDKAEDSHPEGGMDSDGEEEGEEELNG
jgi:hypothetical protein